MRVLIVDDDYSARRFLRHCMRGVQALDIHEASSLATARQALSSQPFDVALIDLCLDQHVSRNRDGLVLVREVREQSTAVPIVVTVAAEMREIRDAIRLGAHSFILKDELCDELVVPVLEELRARRSLEQGVLELEGLIGTSTAMGRLRRTIRRVAHADGPALILGPTGSGKELVAHAIHTLSARRPQPLVTVNCGALTESLAEAQLFGHEKGFFTGADRARPGFLVETGAGTLFLDEIAELPLPLQAKLLRVLENRTFRALGAPTDTRFNGRVIAATHVDFEAQRRQGRFREDLFYRLEVLTVRVPSLDERKEDIPALAERFVREAERPVTISEEAKEALMQLNWPGNVRQLRNLMHRLTAFVEGDTIQADDVREHQAATSQDAGAYASSQARSAALASGLSLYATKRQNTQRLVQTQIRLLEAEGVSVEDICRILNVVRSSFFRLKSGSDDEDRS